MSGDNDSQLGQQGITETQPANVGLILGAQVCLEEGNGQLPDKL